MKVYNSGLVRYWFDKSQTEWCAAIFDTDGIQVGVVEKSSAKHLILERVTAMKSSPEYIIHSFVSAVRKREFDILKAQDDGKNVFSKFSIDHRSTDKAVIIFGDNGSGKSLLAKQIKEQCVLNKIKCNLYNMQLRSSSSFTKSYFFSGGNLVSTSAVSIKSMMNSFKKEGNPFIIMDEPDVGLSEKYMTAFGQVMAEKVNRTKRGLALITHSKKVLSAFIKTLNGQFTTIGVNTDLSFDQWMETDTDATVEEMLSMVENQLKSYEALRGAIG